MGCGVSKTDTPLSVVPRMATARLPFGYSRISAGTVGPLRPPAMGVALLTFDHKELTFFYEIIFFGAIMNTTSGGVLLPIVSAACCSAGILQLFPALSFCYRFPSLSLCLSCSMAAWLMAFNTSPHYTPFPAWWSAHLPDYRENRFHHHQSINGGACLKSLRSLRNLYIFLSSCFSPFTWRLLSCRRLLHA